MQIMLMNVSVKVTLTWGWWFERLKNFIRKRDIHTRKKGGFSEK